MSIQAVQSGVGLSVMAVVAVPGDRRAIVKNEDAVCHLPTVEHLRRGGSEKLVTTAV